MTNQQSLATASHLIARAAWVRRLREWFWNEGFIEVETPVLSWDTVVDRHLEPIPVPVSGIMPGSADSRAMYLQTSPEFGMKRLLSQRLPMIFQVGHAFRAGERGALHNTEFTMAEWYCVGDNYLDGIERLSRLATAMFPQLNEPAAACQQRSYRDLFLEFASVDPFDPCDESFKTLFRRSMAASLSSVNEVLHLQSGDSLDRQLALDLLLDHWVQPALQRLGAVIVYDFPAEQSALAQVATRDYGRVAERFELFINGVELANGYHELLDGSELVRRNREVNAQREQDGKPRLPETSRLIQAMQQLPACSGVALGVDRAVMIALGATTLDEVWAFPWEIA
jgi:lysyl-tRNA synthetase class 2